MSIVNIVALLIYLMAIAWGVILVRTRSLRFLTPFVIAMALGALSLGAHLLAEKRSWAILQEVDVHSGIAVAVSISMLFTVFSIKNFIRREMRLSEAQRSSETKFTNLAEQSPNMIFINREGTIKYVNQKCSNILGYTREEFYTPHFDFTTLIAPETIDLVKINMSKQMRGEDVPPYECVIVTKAGEKRTTIMSTTLIDYEGVRAILGIITDITEHKRAETKMKEMELKAQITSRLASIGEMAAGIAHEINNPLTPALGYADLLLKRDLPKDIKADLKVINDSVRRAAGVTKRLLTFARQVKPERNLTAINDIIETTLQLRAYGLTTGNIKVMKEFDSKLPQTMADGAQLQQVFLNLIMNAEYEMSQAHKGGTILVKTERVGEIIHISVKDDGPGISKENMEKLFTPFFTTKKVGEGTGLGLSVCHGIIAEHNGRIYVESEFGKGATFIVELPVITQEKEEAAEAKATEPDTGKAVEAVEPSVLVVDDEPSIVQFLKQALTDEGYEVKATGKAREALRLIKGGKYDQVLLDIKMPDMSGIKMYEQLDKIDKSLTERIIFITGDVLGSETVDFFSRTGASYVSKPFDIENLKEEIKSKLSLKR